MIRYKLKDVENFTELTKGLKGALTSLHSIADKGVLISDNTEVIAEKLGVTERTIRRWLLALEKEGYIEYTSRRGAKGQVLVKLTSKSVEKKTQEDKDDFLSKLLGETINRVEKEEEDNLLSDVISGNVDLEDLLDKKQKSKCQYTVNRKARTKAKKESDRAKKIREDKEKAERLVRTHREIELNKEVVKVHQDPFTRITYSFFERVCINEEELQEEYMVWLIAKLYASYVVASTEALIDLGINANIDRSYEPLDQVNGWFGTPQHKMYKRIYDTYKDHEGVDYRGLMCQAIAHAFESRYKGVEWAISRGEVPNAKYSRPYQTNLHAETAIGSLVKSVDRLTVARRNGFMNKNNGSLAGYFEPTDDEMLRYIGIPNFNNRVCKDIVREIQSTLKDKLQVEAEMYEDSLYPHYLTIAREMTHIGFEGLSVLKQLGNCGMTIQESVLHSRYLDQVMRQAEANGATKEQLAKVENIVMQLVEFRRTGVDMDMDMFSNPISTVVIQYMKNESDAIVYNDSLTDTEKANLQFELFCKVIPAEYSSKLRNNTLTPKQVEKMTKIYNSIYNLLHKNYTFNIHESHVIAQSRSERLGRNMTTVADTLALIKELDLTDVLCLDEVHLPKWGELVIKLMSGDSEYGEIEDVEDYEYDYNLTNKFTDHMHHLISEYRFNTEAPLRYDEFEDWLLGVDVFNK